MTRTQTLEEFVGTRFGGVLYEGTHQANGKACAIEALNAYHGRDWSDSPEEVHTWDIRTLNDAPWRSDRERTVHLLPLLVAYDGCCNWPLARQQAVVERIVIETVRQIISELPGLSRKMRKSCRECSDMDSAARVTDAANVATAAAASSTHLASLNAAYHSTYAAAIAAAKAGAWEDTYATAASYISTAAARAADVALFTKGAVRATLVKTCEIWLTAARE